MIIFLVQRYMYQFPLFSLTAVGYIGSVQFLNPSLARAPGPPTLCKTVYKYKLWLPTRPLLGLLHLLLTCLCLNATLHQVTSLWLHLSFINLLFFLWSWHLQSISRVT